MWGHVCFDILYLLFILRCNSVHTAHSLHVLFCAYLAGVLWCVMQRAGRRLQVLRQDRAPLLYSLVFGEGVINDATAVALLRAVQVAALATLQRMPVGHVPVVMSDMAGISTSSIKHPGKATRAVFWL